MAGFRVTKVCICVLIAACLFRDLEGLQVAKAQDTNSTERINSLPTTIEIDGELPIRERWKLADKQFKNFVSRIIRRTMPLLIREVLQKNISATCLASFVQLSKGLQQTKLWAFRMLDSSGKFPEGFLAGTFTTLGNYEECVNTIPTDKRVKMRGQYCLVDVEPPLPKWRPFTSLHLTVPELVNISAPDTVIRFLTSMIHNLHLTTIKMGVCFPSTCSISDANNLIQILPEKMGLDWDFRVSRCEVKKEVEFTRHQIVILCVFGIIAMLLLVGSVVGCFIDHEKIDRTTHKGTATLFITSFSIISNIRKMANYVSEDANLMFIYGLMFVSIFWIIVADAFLYINYDVSSNFLGALRMAKVIVYEVMHNRITPIQTLIFLSGFIASYKWIKSPEKTLCVWKYILNRYWRYTPTYMLMIAMILLTPLWGSGPSWFNYMEPTYLSCHSNWWTNMLYVNNYIGADSACMNHAWYFAVDAQLHIIGILILIPLKIRPNVGLILTFVLATASLVTVALTNVYYEIPPNEMIAFLHPRDLFYYAQHSYHRVYTHLFIYCAGIAVGYYMAKKPNLTISKKTRYFFWVFTSGVALGALCVVDQWNLGTIPPPIVGASYAAFSKLTWGLFLSWLTIAFMTSSRGVLRDFLSWRPFSFFSRLFFIAYIIHPQIITMIMSAKNSHQHISDVQILYTFGSHVTCSFLLSYFLFLAFEAPFINIRDIFRKKSRRSLLDNEPNTTQTSLTSVTSVMTEKPKRIDVPECSGSKKPPRTKVKEGAF